MFVKNNSHESHIASHKAALRKHFRGCMWMSVHKPFRPKGITLIETMVYVTIFGVIFALILNFSMFIGESNAKASTRILMNKNLLFLSQHIQEKFRTSDTLDTAISVFDSNTGRLRLIDGISYYDYFITSSRLSINNSGTINVLSGLEYRVTGFLINRVDTSNGTPRGAKVKITLTCIEYPSISNTYETMFLLAQ